MSMQRFMEIINYRITEGSEYCWKCFGPDAYRLDSWNGDQSGHTVGILFDTKTQVTYQFEACDYKNNRAYRWTNPDYKQAHDDEAKIQARGFENQAWDDVDFVDLESLDDFFEKAEAIVQGRDYDTRVQVPIDLPDDVLFKLMKRAHEQDITLNQMVERVLQEVIDRHHNDEAFPSLL